MRAIIISIGDELLNGQVVNTNASWIAEKLHEKGIEVIRTYQVRDDHQDILRFITSAMEEADIVITTGGLGPTRDDITKAVLCEYFNDSLVTDRITLEHITDLFGKRGIDLLESNRKQAEVPSKAVLLKNEIGTAPGLWLAKGGKVLISLPGVPFEMERIVQDSVIPLLVQKVQDVIVSKTALTQGLGESMLAERIRAWEDSLPPHVKLAYLPQPGIVRLRLTARGNIKEELENELAGRFRELEETIPELIFGYDDDKLEKVVGNLLVENGLTLSAAESCTGGYFSHLVTSIPGSSRYFLGGVVSYSNDMKESILKVPGSMIEEKGAVSEEVVVEMAQGVRSLTGSHFSVAISGIAGPEGGTAEKPVGTVWIALAGPEKVVTRMFSFGNHRFRNIRRSALSALNMLREELLAFRGR